MKVHFTIGKNLEIDRELSAPEMVDLLMLIDLAEEASSEEVDYHPMLKGRYNPKVEDVVNESV